MEPVSPPVIQRIAPGLVGFLGTKNLGRGNPASLAEVLAGTLDLTNWYLSAAYEYITATLNMNAVGGFSSTSLNVPGNEYWWVHRYACWGSTAAAEAITLQTAITPGGLTPFFVTGVSQTVAASQRFGVFMDQPIILPPGSLIGVWVNAITTAGNIVGNHHLMFTRLSP